VMIVTGTSFWSTSMISRVGAMVVEVIIKLIEN
jgi:hypothetical protein